LANLALGVSGAFIGADAARTSEPSLPMASSAEPMADNAAQPNSSFPIPLPGLFGLLNSQLHGETNKLTAETIVKAAQEIHPIVRPIQPLVDKTADKDEKLEADKANFPEVSDEEHHIAVNAQIVAENLVKAAVTATGTMVPQSLLPPLVAGFVAHQCATTSLRDVSFVEGIGKKVNQAVHAVAEFTRGDVSKVPQQPLRDYRDHSKEIESTDEVRHGPNAFEQVLSFVAPAVAASTGPQTATADVDKALKDNDQTLQSDKKIPEDTDASAEVEPDKKCNDDTLKNLGKIIKDTIKSRPDQPKVPGEKKTNIGLSVVTNHQDNLQRFPDAGPVKQFISTSLRTATEEIFKNGTATGTAAVGGLMAGPAGVAIGGMLGHRLSAKEAKKLGAEVGDRVHKIFGTDERPNVQVNSSQAASCPSPKEKPPTHAPAPEVRPRRDTATEQAYKAAVSSSQAADRANNTPSAMLPEAYQAQGKPQAYAKTFTQFIANTRRAAGLHANQADAHDPKARHYQALRGEVSAAMRSVSNHTDGHRRPFLILAKPEHARRAQSAGRGIRVAGGAVEHNGRVCPVEIFDKLEAAWHALYAGTRSHPKKLDWIFNQHSMSKQAWDRQAKPKWDRFVKEFLMSRLPFASAHAAEGPPPPPQPDRSKPLHTSQDSRIHPEPLKPRQITATAYMTQLNLAAARPAAPPPIPNQNKPLSATEQVRQMTLNAALPAAQRAQDPRSTSQNYEQCFTRAFAHTRTGQAAAQTPASQSNPPPNSRDYSTVLAASFDNLRPSAAPLPTQGKSQPTMAPPLPARFNPLASFIPAIFSQQAQGAAPVVTPAPRSAVRAEAIRQHASAQAEHASFNSVYNPGITALSPHHVQPRAHASYEPWRASFGSFPSPNYMGHATTLPTSYTALFPTLSSFPSYSEQRERESQLKHQREADHFQHQLDIFSLQRQREKRDYTNRAEHELGKARNGWAYDVKGLDSSDKLQCLYAFTSHWKGEIERSTSELSPYAQQFANTITSSTVYLAALVDSYNQNNDNAISCYMAAMNPVGGIETQKSILEGMKDAPLHAFKQPYHRVAVLTPDGKVLFSDGKLQQLLRDIYRGVQFGRYLWCSEHFNKDATIYPVIDPVYQDTEAGKVILLLDFWLKGFLNGGVYDEAFLDQWHFKGNTDRKYLQDNLINLKEYCKKHAPSIPYVSLREAMIDAGLDEMLGSANASSGGAAGDQSKFSSSFRIIAKAKSAREQDGVFLIETDFDVLYTIHPSKTYSDFINQYKSKHGEYPEEYQTVQRVYQEAATRVKEQMPKIPMFREYFNMYLLMTGMSSYYTTLKSMGIPPDFEAVTKAERVITPKLFPHHPLHYYAPHKMHLSLKTLIEHFEAQLPDQEEEGESLALDKAFTRMLNVRRWSFDASETLLIKQAIKTLLQDQRPAQLQTMVIDDKTIDRCFNQLKSKMIAELLSFSKASELLELAERLENNLLLKGLVVKFKKLKGGVSEKIQFLRQALEDHEKSQVELIKNKHIPGPQMAPEERLQIDEVTQLMVSIGKGKLALKKATIIQNLSTFPTEQALSRASETTRRSLYQKKAGLEKELNEWPIESVVESTVLFGAIMTNAREIIDKYEAYSEQVSCLFASDKSYDTSVLPKFRQSLMGIADNQYFKDTGDTVRIVGGCGIERPTLPLKPPLKTEAALFAKLARHPLTGTEAFSVVPGTPAYALFQLKVGKTAQLRHFQSAPGVQVIGEAEKAALLSMMCEQPMPPCNTKAVDAHGQTMMHHAIAMKSLPVIKTLHQNDPTFMTRPDNRGFLPLHHAAGLGDVDLLRFILVAFPGALEAITHGGITPLMIAARRGHTRAVELLLARQANPNAALASGLTPLWLALHGRYEDTALALINSPLVTREILNGVLDQGQNLLLEAMEQRLPLVIDVLMGKEGIEIVAQARFADGMTPWHLAVKQGNIALVKKMLATAKVTINAPTPSGETALHIAAQAGDEAMVTFLVDHGADVSMLDQCDKSPLDVAIEHGKIATARLLAARPGKCSAETLLKAAQRNLFDVCDVLIEQQGADPHAPLNEENPRDYAYYLVLRGETERLKRWVDAKKINLSTMYQGTSLLGLAAARCHTAMVTELMSANVAYHTEDDRELIHWAVAGNNVDLVREWLSQHKLDEGTMTKGHEKGKTLAYLAAEHGSVEVFKLLKPFLTPADQTQAWGKKHLMDGALRSGVERMVEQLQLEDMSQPINEAGQTPFMLSVALGQKAFALHCLRWGADPFQLLKGETALHTAVRLNDDDLLDALIEVIPMVTWPDDLWALAVAENKTQVIKWFEKRSEAMDTFALAEIQGKQTPLNASPHAQKVFIESAAKGLLEPIEKLIKAGMDVNLVIDGQTALTAAVKHHQTKMIALLLLHGAKADMPTLSVALENNDIESLRTFHQAGQLSLPSQPTLSSAAKTLYTKAALEGDFTAYDNDVIRLNDIVESMVLSDYEEFVTSPLHAGFPLNQVMMTKLAVMSEGDLPLAFLLVLSAFHEDFLAGSKDWIALDGLDKDGNTFACHLANMDPEALECCIERIKKHIPEQIPQLLAQSVSAGVSLLQVALANRREDILALILENDATAAIDERFENGQTKLHFAVKMSNDQQIDNYLKELPVDVQDDHGNTPLMCAAALDSVTTVDKLLAKGANPDRLNQHQHMPLHIALRLEAASTASQLIPVTTDIDKPDRFGQTPLMFAAQHGMTEALDALLARGASTTARDEKGFTAMHLAAQAGKVSCLERLLAHGADINATLQVEHPDPDKRGSKETPLHLATQQGHRAACQYLIQQNADVSLKDLSGVTALDCAFIQRNTELVTMFSQIQAFSDPKHALNKIRAAMSSDNLPALRQLLAMGIDMNQVDEQRGLTALHYAATSKANLCAKLVIGRLLEMRCPIDAADHQGYTPMHHAAKSGSVGIIDLLTSHGSPVDVFTQKGKTPLILAIEAQKTGAVLALIRAGANLLLPSKQGVEPVCAALEKGSFDLATTLMIISGQLITVNDFIGIKLPLRENEKIQTWLKSITALWKTSIDAGDTDVHRAIRLNSPHALRELSIRSPGLFSKPNAQGKTPRALALELNQADLLASYDALLDISLVSVQRSGVVEKGIFARGPTYGRVEKGYYARMSTSGAAAAPPPP
jgi:ankyrin repeat protein